jgi:hypothetical protein
VRALHGGCEGREKVGKEVERFKDGRRRDQGVVERVEVAVDGFAVGGFDAGVKVELERWESALIISRYDNGLRRDGPNEGS